MARWLSVDRQCLTSCCFQAGDYENAEKHSMQLWRQVNLVTIYHTCLSLAQTQQTKHEYAGSNEHWDSAAAQLDPFPMPEVRQVCALQHPGHQAEPLAGRGLLQPWQRVQGEGTAAGGPR